MHDDDDDAAHQSPVTLCIVLPYAVNRDGQASYRRSVLPPTRYTARISSSDVYDLQTTCRLRVSASSDW